IETIKNKVIALCMADFRTEYNNTIMNKICQYAEKIGYKVLIFASFSELIYSEKHDIGEENIYNLMNLNIIDGVIILSETIKGKEHLMRIVDNSIKHGVPVISIEKEVDGCYNLIFDYENSIVGLVNHFIEHHKFTKINFMAGGKGNEYSEERLSGYKKALKEHDIPLDERRVAYGDFWDRPTYKAMDEFMASGMEMPEAIVCANDAMAIAVCEKLREYGYRVPEDVCVSGFDGSKEEKHHTPRLTTAHQDLESMAMRAFEKLKDIFDGKETSRCELVQNKLVISQSCGCEKREPQPPNSYIRCLNSDLAEKNTFNMTMIRMVSALCDGGSIEECMEEIQQYLHYIKFTKIWICIIDDFISEVSAIEEVFKEERRYSVGYPERMKILLHKDGEHTTSGQIFSVGEMLPNLAKELETEDKILFSPLHFQDKVIGYVAITFDLPTYGFNKFHSFIMNLSNVLETIKNNTEMKTVIQKLEEMYVHDSMTGLYNRRGFYKNVYDLFNKCKRLGKKLVIISLDLDGLKIINDVHGHSEGDNAIKVLANALRSSSVKDEICARFGGDEYIVASTAEDQDEGSEYVNDYINKVQKYLNDYNASSGRDYEIGASYGVVKQVPSPDMTLDGMIKIADALMYKDKFKRKKYREPSRNKEKNALHKGR
ncbi:MAG TPA: GGDEF domain-containing protein, partial [Clostridiales bacterium]|nr:GGDEF domain-containing protein [Clostridiales bacterium]